ncbi:hypothetical protein [Actinomycetospora flava]|uniref:YCII-related domain-containing protein n=1 Tax=Actinomycetospora flava TaxID=3129232 RepID=A0ABU8MF82_9PSEU
MYTMIVGMTLDPARPEDVDRHFYDDVVPWAWQQPGFVSGRWLRSIDNARGQGVVVFDSAPAAEDAAAAVRATQFPPGTAWSIDGVLVFELITEAEAVRS